MSGQGQSVVVDLNEFKRRRQAQRAASQPIPAQPPVAVPCGLMWVMVLVPMWYWLAG